MAMRHGESGVVVSHRVVCKVVLCAALGVGEEGFWRVRVDTGSVSVLQKGEGGWVVVGANDRCHLRGQREGDRVDF